MSTTTSWSVSVTSPSMRWPSLVVTTPVLAPAVLTVKKTSSVAITTAIIAPPVAQRRRFFMRFISAVNIFGQCKDTHRRGQVCKCAVPIAQVLPMMPVTPKSIPVAFAAVSSVHSGHKQRPNRKESVMIRSRMGMMGLAVSTLTIAAMGAGCQNKVAEENRALWQQNRELQSRSQSQQSELASRPDAAQLQSLQQQLAERDAKINDLQSQLRTPTPAQTQASTPAETNS